MELNDVNSSVLLETLASMPKRFRTKQLSDRPAMRAVHGSSVNESHYHAVIGKYLSQHSQELGLHETGEAETDQGVMWEKVR